MQIFQDNEMILKQKFGLPAMAVVIIGLLRQKNVQITEPVLELCRPVEPLASLLKDRTLVTAIDKPEDFEAIQMKHDPQRQFPLLLLDNGIYRILALQDEVLAEAGWQKQLESQNKSLTATTNNIIAYPETHLQGLEHLFNQDELNKLKLTIATTVKPEEKIEALRKMVLAKASPTEKALLFLHALGDLQWSVQREATQSLRSIGVNPELINTILLLGNSENEKQQSFYNLGLMFGKVNDFEKGVILQILLTTIQMPENRYLAKYWLVTLRKITPHLLGEFTPMLERILNVMMEHLITKLDDLLESATELILEISHSHANFLCSFLLRQICKQEQGRLRAFLLSQIALYGDSNSMSALAKDMVYEFGLGDTLDIVHVRLSVSLLKLDGLIVPALLERLENTLRSTERVSIIKLLEKMYGQLNPLATSANLEPKTPEPTSASATSANLEPKTPDLASVGTSANLEPKTPDLASVGTSANLEPKISNLAASLKNAIAQSYVNIFSKISDSVRLILLDNTLIADSEVNFATKQNFAISALMEIQGGEKFGQYPQAVNAMLCRIPEPAVVALLQVLERPLKDIQLRQISEILGQVTLTLGPEHTSQLMQIYHFCLQQIENKAGYSENMYVVLGKVAGTATMIQDLAENISDYLLDSIYHSPNAYAVLEGLGWAISTSATSLATKTDVAYLFMALLDSRLPEKLCSIQKNGDENVMIFDKKVSAYTDMLPILLKGLQRLVLSASTSETLRKKISEYLLKKWQNIIEYTMLWGPKNTIDLAEILADIARHAHLPPNEQKRIAEALYQRISILTIAKLLVKILVDINLPSLSELSQSTANCLLKFTSDEDYHNSEDLENIYDCIGNLVYCQYLAPDSKTSETLRQRLIYSLLDGLREQIFGTQAILQNLARWPLLSPLLCTEILQHLPQQSKNA